MMKYTLEIIDDSEFNLEIPTRFLKKETIFYQLYKEGLIKIYLSCVTSEVTLTAAGKNFIA
ncbi:hypothetical protein [Pedobacter sp. MR2016-24]|uniref:hypothetical protein n=1 Tax=Pedobacter sp. MR2016-24 TaxID=2994466 RepID=UPI002246CE82|nr:hypothetical protein [Pedobacter sp. MR2016-24]MCX2484862.1 hypothetical protein [Pedobacter sp. MR2016-24]